jgi:hypothetical protein
VEEGSGRTKIDGKSPTMSPMQGTHPIEHILCGIFNCLPHLLEISQPAYGVIDLSGSASDSITQKNKSRKLMQLVRMRKILLLTTQKSSKLEQDTIDRKIFAQGGSEMEVLCW